MRRMATRTAIWGLCERWASTRIILEQNTVLYIAIGWPLISPTNRPTNPGTWLPLQFNLFCFDEY